MHTSPPQWRTNLGVIWRLKILPPAHTYTCPLVRVEAALRCLYHPFVHGIAAGKLPLASFKNYVGQDAFFLNAFSDAYKR